MAKITLVNSVDGDWVGLYNGDKLIMQNHSLDLSSVLKHLNIDVVEGEAEFDSHLPSKLSEVDFTPYE